jgi:carbohydrate-selective porin OprB
MKKMMSDQLSTQARRSGVRALITSSIAAAAMASAFAGVVYSPSSEVVVEKEGSSFSGWWNGKQMTGNWFGLRDTFEDRGLTFKGKYEGIFFGVVDSQKGARGFYDQEIAFSSELDIAKFTGVEALEGLTAFGGVRYRDSRSNSNPNNFVEASSLFQPSSIQSGTQWRLLTFGLEYATPEMFGVENFLTVRGGWLQPQKEFIDQPLSKLFINNAIQSAKGEGGNIPFSSSFSTWGGTLKIKPTDITYTKAGLFMAFPQSTSSSNHGLAFEGFAQDPSQNGLFAIAEAGIEPKFGASELPGKYAVGGSYYGQQKNSFNGTDNYGQFAFYWQADQMLFRESSPAPEPVVFEKGAGKNVVSAGKNFKEPVAAEKPKLSKQGLYTFNLLSFAPKYNNLFPFYFQTGLVYEGLIPGRDADRTMFAMAFGQYSYENIQNLQQQGRVNQPNYTIVLEWDYRIQLGGFTHLQPFCQYIIQPNGTGAVKNATILGFAYGMNF